MTNKITYLDDGEFCIIKKTEVSFFNEQGKKINKKILSLTIDEQNYDKGDYKHFMAKEIDEQPLTIKNCINEYVDKTNNEISIFNFPWRIKDISSIRAPFKFIEPNILSFSILILLLLSIDSSLVSFFTICG